MISLLLTLVAANAFSAEPPGPTAPFDWYTHDNGGLREDGPEAGPRFDAAEDELEHAARVSGEAAGKRGELSALTAGYAFQEKQHSRAELLVNAPESAFLPMDRNGAADLTQDAQAHTGASYLALRAGPSEVQDAYGYQTLIEEARDKAKDAAAKSMLGGIAALLSGSTLGLDAKAREAAEEVRKLADRIEEEFGQGDQARHIRDWIGWLIGDGDEKPDPNALRAKL